MSKSQKNFKPYVSNILSKTEIIDHSQAYYNKLEERRSIRQFSDQEVPKIVIENIIKAASTAPSGAHKQPWTFCAISDPILKSKVRTAAEKEEYDNYHGRMSETWLEDLKAFDTDWNKPFLDIAPWLIVVFRKSYDIDKETGKKLKNYYVNESVGIATGFLLQAIHHAGLVTLTHTPSPMNFLEKILERPPNEKAFLLIPVGYPAQAAKVPVLERKTLDEMAVFYE